MTGAAAEKAKELATQVSPEAKEWVIKWLKDDFDVSLE
jgi:hypothetical protein